MLRTGGNRISFLVLEVLFSWFCLRVSLLVPWSANNCTFPYGLLGEGKKRSTCFDGIFWNIIIMILRLYLDLFALGRLIYGSSLRVGVSNSFDSAHLTLLISELSLQPDTTSHPLSSPSSSSSSSSSACFLLLSSAFFSFRRCPTPPGRLPRKSPDDGSR